MKKYGLSVLCALSLATVLSFGAAAAPVRSNVAASDNVETFITLETTGVAPGQTVWAALTQNIRPHWHTYWINPGDSGIPTEIAWTLPEGWSAAAITWPAPERFPIGPLVNFGYKDTVHLLVPLTVPADAPAGQTVRLDAQVDWLVCEDICIPESAELSIAVPVLAQTAPADPDAAALFAAARAALPVPSPYEATLTPGEKTHRLTLAAPGLDRGRVTDVFFFPHEYTVAASNAAQPVSMDAAGLTLTLQSAGTLPAAPVTGVLTFTEPLDGQNLRHALAVEAAVGPAAAGTVPPPPAGPQTGLLSALLLALAGGAILNLMPCVFPVLSMKALALMRHGPGEARRHGLAYTAGVLVCFAVVAGALIALRAGGAAIGWGFQLQDPVVVAVLAYVMLLLGLSLSGVFTLGGSVMGMGQGLAGRDGLAGSFFTGVLATVVATPCTAPFMGTALGFAITQPWPVALAVFLALGLGMALPFLALSFSPALLKRLPRPGLWMERVKQALAFPLYASAAWLLWVLSIQAGPAALATVLAGMVALAFAAWVYGQTRLSGGGLRAFGTVLAVLALGGAIAGATTAAPPAGGQGPVAGADASAAGFTPWTPERQAALLAEGKPVFVNFTAAWCVTCLVNERTSLSTAGVRQALDHKGVTYLKGDWTNRDATIARVLESHGRSGVPLYLLYRPGEQAPVILPQILTEGIVLDALAPLPPA